MNTLLSGVVSVVIPLYNTEKYIAECLDSIISQSYDKLEIIVVDDGSTDDSAKIVAYYQQKYPCICFLQQQNSGAAIARNKALEIAKGEFLLFLDSDDYLESDTIRLNVEKLQLDSELDWVSFPIKRKFISDCCLNLPYLFKPDDECVIEQKDYVRYYRLNKLSKLCCGTLYRRSSVINIRFPMEYYEDSFFFTAQLRCTKKGCLSTDGAYVYRCTPNSSQHQNINFERLKSKMNCLLDAVTAFRQISPDCEEFCREMEGNFFSYLQWEKLKGVGRIEEIIYMFVGRVGRELRRPFLVYLIHCIVKIIGYNQLKAIATICKKK